MNITEWTDLLQRLAIKDVELPSPLVGYRHFHIKLEVDDFLNVSEIQDALVFASGEEAARDLSPLTVPFDDCVGVSAESTVDLLFFEHLLESFDSCHALEPDTRVVVHPER